MAVEQQAAAAASAGEARGELRPALEVEPAGSAAPATSRRRAPRCRPRRRRPPAARRGTPAARPPRAAGRRLARGGVEARSARRRARRARRGARRSPRRCAARGRSSSCMQSEVGSLPLLHEHAERGAAALRIAQRLEPQPLGVVARELRDGRARAAGEQPLRLRHVERRAQALGLARRAHGAEVDVDRDVLGPRAPTAVRRRPRRRGRCAGAHGALVARRPRLAVVEHDQRPARERAGERLLQLGLRGCDVVLGAVARRHPGGQQGIAEAAGRRARTKRKRRSGRPRRAARRASAGGARDRRRAPRWRRSPVHAGELARARRRARRERGSGPARASPRRARRARGRAAGRRARRRDRPRACRPPGRPRRA